jgi:hypothetical protein
VGIKACDDFQSRVEIHTGQQVERDMDAIGDSWHSACWVADE